MDHRLHKRDVGMLTEEAQTVPYHRLPADGQVLLWSIASKPKSSTSRNDHCRNEHHPSPPRLTGSHQPKPQQFFDFRALCIATSCFFKQNE
jgi:hypothetical protein